MTDFEQHLLTTMRGTVTPIYTMPKPAPGEVIVLGIPEKNWPTHRQVQYAERIRDAFREIFPDNPVIVVDQQINILLMQDPDACAMARDAICQDALTKPRTPKEI